MTWFINQLIEDTAVLHGKDRADLLRTCVTSVPKRFMFARYHLDQACKLIEAATASHDAPTMLMWLMGTEAEDPDNAVNLVVFRASAHVMSCVQNLHSLGDLLGHAIDLALTEGAMPKRGRYGAEVLKQLEHGSLLQEVFRQFLDGGEALYISSLSNCAKHRHVISSNFSMNFAEQTGPQHGLQFQSFTYSGKTYSARWAIPILEDEIKRRGFLIEAVGHRLNETVACRLTGLR